jgi:molybdate transport system substrate-binding protein
MKTKMSIFTIALTLIFSAFSFAQAEQKITIVAAANVKPALDSIISIYKMQNPSEGIQVTYGASGKLYEQISNAAPFDIFFSADMDYPTKLKDKKLTVSAIKIYGIGQLVIWSKKTDPNEKKMTLLLEPSINKIAIANPVTAPYGEKAVESMKYYKVYSTAQSKLVYGENITQTAQFVTFGAADVGILALSQALSPSLKKEGGNYFIIPEKSHKPLEQGCVILKHAKGNAVALKFYDFVSSATAVDILTYYGYTQKVK